MAKNKDLTSTEDWGKAEWIGFVILFSFMMWVFFKVMFGIASVFDPKEDLEHDAFTFCTILVDAQLKSPATAKYPYNFRDYVEIKENKYTVDAYVDAQNSFGALGRTHFICALEKESGSSWELVKLKVEE